MTEPGPTGASASVRSPEAVLKGLTSGHYEGWRYGEVAAVLQSGDCCGGTAYAMVGKHGRYRSWKHPDCADILDLHDRGQDLPMYTQYSRDAGKHLEKVLRTVDRRGGEDDGPSS